MNSNDFQIKEQVKELPSRVAKFFLDISLVPFISFTLLHHTRDQNKLFLSGYHLTAGDRRGKSYE